MCHTATDGGHLANLVHDAIALCQAAQQRLPQQRTGPGRPDTYKQWQLAVLIFIAIVHKRKSKSSQWQYLAEHQAAFLKRWGDQLELNRFPGRGTYMARYAQAYALYEQAIELQGRKALAQHACCAKVVAADKSIVAAKGPPYHKHQQRTGTPDPGTDTQAAWGYSPHDDWVWGYSYEVVVCATKNHVVFPLLASAGTASCNEHKSFLAKVPRLPASVRYVLADGGYDDNDIAEAIERRPGRHTTRGGRSGDKSTGRRFICPLQSRGGKPAVGQMVHRGRRERRRQHRALRDRFNRSDYGRRLYKLRSRTVEPFNQWFKHLFDLEDRVWHRGLGNNRTMFLAAIFAYQLLLRHSIKSGRRDGCVQWLLDAL